MSSAFGVVCESMPLVTGVILLALLAIPKRASATTRHQVQVVAALLCLAAPLLLRGMPDWQVLPRPSAPVMAVVAPAVSDLATAPLDSVRLEESPAVVSLPRADRATAPETYRRWFRVAAALWLAGTALALLRLACNAAALRRWVRGSVAAPPELENLAATIPGPPVRLRIAEGQGDAFVYRVFSPVVVLPVSVASLPQEQIRMVLEHELAHVRRRDPLWAWVFEAFRAIYWFHPLAWLLVKRSHLAREMAADDLVLLDGRAPEAYAACLGAAALRHRAQAAPPLPAVAFVRQHPVLARLHAILDATRRRTAPSTGGWLAVGLPLAVPALVLASLGFKAAAEAQPAQQRRALSATAKLAPPPSLWSDLIEPLVVAGPTEPQPAASTVAVPAPRVAAPLPTHVPEAPAPRREARARHTPGAWSGAAPESSSVPVSVPEGSPNYGSPTAHPPLARGFGFRRPVPADPPAGPAEGTPTPPSKPSTPTPSPAPEKPGSDTNPPPVTPPHEPDSGTDPGTDPGPDTGTDTGTDTGSDGGTDTGSDTGSGEDDGTDEPTVPPPPTIPSPSLPPKPKPPPPPSGGASGALPVLEIIPYETDAGAHFAVSWTVAEGEAATWTPEVSPDQAAWTSDPEVVSVEGPIPADIGTVRFIAVIREPMPDSYHRFLRLTTTPGSTGSK